MYRSIIVAALFATSTFASSACKKESPSSSEREAPVPTAAGGGPSAEVSVPDVHYSSAPADIAKGEELFATKSCNACHHIGGDKESGVDLKGVTARRDKQWIAKMLVRPDVLFKEDPTAQDLLKTHYIPMVNQGVDDRELVLLMSYLKANE